MTSPSPSLCPHGAADSLMCGPCRQDIETRLEAAEATITRIRALHQAWQDETRDWYYDNRYTHEYGINYVSGFEDGWNHADELLRRALDGEAT